VLAVRLATEGILRWHGLITISQSALVGVTADGAVPLCICYSASRSKRVGQNARAHGKRRRSREARGGFHLFQLPTQWTSGTRRTQRASAVVFCSSDSLLVSLMIRARIYESMNCEARVWFIHSSTADFSRTDSLY